MLILRYNIIVRLVDCILSIREIGCWLFRKSSISLQEAIDGTVP